MYTISLAMRTFAAGLSLILAFSALAGCRQIAPNSGKLTIEPGRSLVLSSAGIVYNSPYSFPVSERSQDLTATLNIKSGTFSGAWIGLDVGEQRFWFGVPSKNLPTGDKFDVELTAQETGQPVGVRGWMQTELLDEWEEDRLRSSCTYTCMQLVCVPVCTSNGKTTSCTTQCSMQPRPCSGTEDIRVKCTKSKQHYVADLLDAGAERIATYVGASEDLLACPTIRTYRSCQ